MIDVAEKAAVIGQMSTASNIILGIMFFIITRRSLGFILIDELIGSNFNFNSIDFEFDEIK